MAKESILIIDDDTYIRNACAEFLVSEGYSVSTAENGEKGVEVLRKSNYDLVITDFKMPGMDGIEVLKHVKEISPKTDVIIITAHGTIENAVKAMRLGAYDYLTKDFDINELELVVKRCLEKQRLSAQVSELKEVVNLYEASKAINSLMGIDVLLNLILELLCDTLSANGGSIMLYSPENGELKVRVAIGPYKEALAGKTFALPGDSSIKGALRNDPRFTLLKEINDVQSTITVPLERKGTLLGVINLQRKEHSTQFTQRDEVLLSIFAAEAAVAIENTYLYNSLKHEKEELNAVFTNMADGSVTMDLDFRVVRMNNSAEELLGVALADIRNRNLIDGLADYTPSLPWDAITGSPDNILHFELSRTKGKNLYLGLVSTKIFDDQNQHSGYIWVIRDVTEEKKEGKHKNDFLAIMSHKLRTPLTTIIGYSTVLNDRLKEADERTLFALNSIRKQGDLLNDLVDSLLRFTSLESESTQLELEQIPLKTIIDSWTRKFHDTVVDGHGQLIVDSGIEQMPLLYVDRQKMVELVDNLIKNAIKFNNKENREVRISARVTDENFITMDVTDNGNGLPSEESQKIFKKFYQIDEYETGQVKGMGLGLALVKRIAEIHGGQVWVKSTIGAGSTFSVTLPIAKIS